MYKVFINDKPVVLCHEGCVNENKESQIFYEFKSAVDLEHTINWFETDQHSNELIINNRNNFDLLLETFLSLFTVSFAAGGIVFSPEKGMLWILRHNRWDLPKGKANHGESIEETALREVEEETGLKHLRVTNSLGLTRHAYREKGRFILKISHWFAMSVDDPNQVLKPQLNEDITKVEWADETTINEKIRDTYASLQTLAVDYVTKYTEWKIR